MQPRGTVDSVIPVLIKNYKKLLNKALLGLGSNESALSSITIEWEHGPLLPLFISRFGRLNCEALHTFNSSKGYAAHEDGYCDSTMLIRHCDKQPLKPVIESELNQVKNWEITCARFQEMADSGNYQENNQTPILYLLIIFNIFIYAHFIQDNKKNSLKLIFDHSREEKSSLAEKISFSMQRLQAFSLTVNADLEARIEESICEGYHGYQEEIVTPPSLVIEKLTDGHTVQLEEEIIAVENILTGVSTFTADYLVLIRLLPYSLIELIAGYYFTVDDETRNNIMEKVKIAAELAVSVEKPLLLTTPVALPLASTLPHSEDSSKLDTDSSSSNEQPRNTIPTNKNVPLLSQKSVLQTDMTTSSSPPTSLPPPSPSHQRPIILQSAAIASSASLLSPYSNPPLSPVIKAPPDTDPKRDTDNNDNNQNLGANITSTTSIPSISPIPATSPLLTPHTAVMPSSSSPTSLPPPSSLQSLFSRTRATTDPKRDSEAWIAQFKTEYTKDLKASWCGRNRLRNYKKETILSHAKNYCFFKNRTRRILDKINVNVETGLQLSR